MQPALSDNELLAGYIQRIQSRLESIERESVAMEKKIAVLDTVRSQSFTQLHHRIAEEKNTLQKMKQIHQQQQLAMVTLTKDIRDSLKKEQVVAAGERIEQIPFDEFVKKKDLEEL